MFPKEYQLSQSKKYHILIGIPDKAPENILVETIGTNELFVKKSPSTLTCIAIYKITMVKAKLKMQTKKSVGEVHMTGLKVKLYS